MNALAATVLLVALLAAAYTSPAAAQRVARSSQVTPCDVRAYVNDPDPRGLNVRSGPGTTHKVVGNLPDQQAEGIEVHINGSQGEWVRIDLAEEQGGDPNRTFFRGEGWVYARSLGVDGSGGHTPHGTPLYANPARGRPAGYLSVEGGGARVRGCRGRWTQIEYKGRLLWGAPGTLCYLAITNCS